MIKTWAITDVGLVRKENQDTYRIARNGGVCVVCDGMGGAAGGRIASTLAAETYVAELDKVLKPDMTPEQLREASSYAVAMANQAVENRAMEDAELSNMGTTLVSAIAYEGGTVITNIGDSRAYYITEAGITRITKDHSLVESMVDHGDITADEAERLADEGQFGKGSMEPKVRAAIKFARSRKGRTCIIGALDKAAETMAGLSGTRICG